MSPDPAAPQSPESGVARCGHRLRGAATLYDEAPDWMSVLPALDRAVSTGERYPVTDSRMAEAILAGTQ